MSAAERLRYSGEDRRKTSRASETREYPDLKEGADVGAVAAVVVAAVAIVAAAASLLGRCAVERRKRRWWEGYRRSSNR